MAKHICCSLTSVRGGFIFSERITHTDSGAFSTVGTEGRRSFCRPAKHDSHIMIELGMKT